MNVISRKTLVKFYEKHADSWDPIETWYKVCKKINWKNFNEVQKLYPMADVVGDNRMVFNFKGNKYRMVVRFSFHYKAIMIKWIGTHAEYNQINVLEI